jgi:hypothetical protein
VAASEHQASPRRVTGSELQASPQARVPRQRVAGSELQASPQAVGGGWLGPSLRRVPRQSAVGWVRASGESPGTSPQAGD